MGGNPSEAQEEALELLFRKANGWTLETRFKRMRLTRRFFSFGKTFKPRNDPRFSTTLLAPVARLAEDCRNHDGTDSEISKWSEWFENDEYSKLEF